MLVYFSIYLQFLHFNLSTWVHAIDLRAKWFFKILFGIFLLDSFVFAADFISITNSEANFFFYLALQCPKMQKFQMTFFYSLSHSFKICRILTISSTFVSLFAMEKFIMYQLLNIWNIYRSYSVHSKISAFRNRDKLKWCFSAHNTTIYDVLKNTENGRSKLRLHSKGSQQ